jgi:hypothetical protein
LPEVTLAPIQTSISSRGSRYSSGCVLPPISTLEDVHSSPLDSLAVLRRLTASDNDDSAYGREGLSDGYKKVWERRRSLSGTSSIRPLPSGYYPTHSYTTLSSERYALPPSSTVMSDRYYPDRGDSSFSSMSDDGHSTCDPSPISPATPVSTSGVLSYTRTSISPRWPHEAAKTAHLTY